MSAAHDQAGEPRLVADVRRRLDLLSRAERLRWLTFFPIGAITAGFETLGGVVVFGLVALLSNPDTAMRQALVAGLARWLSGVGLAATVLTLALVAVALYAVKNLMLLASLYYRAHVIGDIAAGLASRVVRAYLTAPYVFHLRRSSAEVAQNVLTGLPAVLRLLDSVVTFATELFVVIGLMVLLLRLAPIETVVAVALIGGVLGLFLRLTRGRHHRLGVRHHQLSAQVLKRMQQAMGGIKEVKVFGREQYFYDALARAEEARARVGMSYIALESIPRLVAEMSFVLGLAGLILTLQLRTSDFGTALPFIGLYAYAGFRLIPAGHRLNLHLGLIRYDLALSASLTRDVGTLAAIAQSSAAGTGAAEDRKLLNALRLESVSYGYDRESPLILKDINLEIRKGECVALVGATGAGKTTLVDLVLGLLEPLSGKITVDGRLLAEDLRGWQRQVGYVPQDPFLVDDTLRRNVAFGIRDEEIDENAIRTALRVAQLQPFVENLPNGLETVLGERGVRLSGGERQRVSIARALYHNPDVLVFDEATSALDPATEEDLTRAIDHFKGRKTLLVIAHRLTTVERADRLVLLCDGGIEAIGSYSALLRSSPVFRALAAVDSAEISLPQ